MMLSLVLFITANASFPEDFGDLIGPTGCSTAWQDYCEAGWSAQGSPNTSDMATMVGTSNMGVMTSGSGGVWPNGIERIIVPPSNDGYIRFDINVISIDAAKVSQRLVFLNSTGGTIGTKVVSHTLGTWKSYSYSFPTDIPSGTAKVRVQYGVKGTGNPLVWLGSINISYPQDDGTEGGVDVSIECDDADCATMATDECKNYNCDEVICAGGSSPSPTCSGLCLENGICGITKTCACPSGNSIGFDLSATP